MFYSPCTPPIAVRTCDPVGPELEGHAYDISEGGVRFEADAQVPVGTPITMQIALPGAGGAELGAGRTITAFATVAWVEEDDEHPPFRCAAVFTAFANAGDRERLVEAFSTGRYRMVG